MVDAVHRDPYLDAEQKRTLLRVYESFGPRPRRATATEATDGNAGGRAKRQAR